MKNFILFIFILISVFACDTNGNGNPTEFTDVKVSVIDDVIFYTKAGFQVHLHEKFRDKLIQQKVDELDIRIEEYLTIESFIKNDLQTITKDGDILESYGMFKMTVLNSGIEIEKDEICFEFYMPTPSLPNDYPLIQMYNAFSDNKTGITWTNPQALIIDTINPQIEYTYDPTSGKILDSTIVNNEGDHFKGNTTYYIAQIPNNTLINFDAPIFKGEEKHTLEVTSSQEISDISFGVVFNDHNSYLIIIPDDKGNTAIDIPHNANIDVFLIGQIDEQLYYGRTSVKVDAAKKVIISPFETTQEAIEAQLAKY